MTSPIQKSATVARTLALRDQRFDALRQAIEDFECSQCLGHDDTRPGGDHMGRYAVLAHANDGTLLELTRVSKERVQVVVESHVSEGWTVSALYDLDELAGGRRCQEGDIVTINEDDDGLHWLVLHLAEDLVEGEVANDVCLVPEGTDASTLGYDDWDRKEHDFDVTLIKPIEPDERLPVRYTVAGRFTIVVFNTVAS